MKKLFCLLLSFLLILSSISMLSACSFGGGAQLDTDISDDNGDDNPDDGNGDNNTPDDGGNGGNGGSDTPSNPDDGDNSGNDTPSNPDDGGNGGNGGNGGSDTPSNPDDGGADDNPSNEFVETVVDGVTYTPNQSETYTVSAVNLSSTTLTIPETVNGVAVTEIGKDAIRGKTNLLKVVLPDTVKTLDENSFMGCKKLKDINLSKVEVVGKNAFNGAITITNTNIDLSSIKSLGYGAFSSATKLREVDMQNSTLTEIGERAFFGCTLLYTVKLPESVLTIHKQAFETCGCLVNINLDKVEDFKASCFSGCVNLVNLTLTNAVDIRNEAFFSCAKLATVVVGEKIQRIYPRAFYSNPSLLSFTIANTEQAWWYYFENYYADRNGVMHKEWGNREKINTPDKCAEFMMTNQNKGCFICTETWVLARGYTDGQYFVHGEIFNEP